ncbi:hypothetical protein [Kitasatospora brasiliensis]|uniref:hypothetical protein n=1 Tax=Kitasatospora brasiliensis TaxID=3058040 RepID=UPI002931E16E|nr:hypothetical protein [Kitasatospora sp. K002]
MSTPKANIRRAATTAALAAALIGLGAGAADAAGWPPLQPGARLYSAADGQGSATNVDLNDYGTCHTLSTPVRSMQIVNGSASVELFPSGDCVSDYWWASGSLGQSNLPFGALSYRVVKAS